VLDTILDGGASASGADGSGSGEASYGEWGPGRGCDQAMCRTTDGHHGFDCWADGVWEKFECADGYQALLTGASRWVSAELRLHEITCCRNDKEASGGVWPPIPLLKFVNGSLQHCANEVPWADLASSPAFRQVAASPCFLV